MTNKEYMESLAPEQQADFKATYSKERQGELYDYIDWNAWWNSEDRNELHFLKCMYQYVDEREDRYAVLNTFPSKSADGATYVNIYSFSEQCMYQMPLATDEYGNVLENYPYNVHEGEGIRFSSEDPDTLLDEV